MPTNNYSTIRFIGYTIPTTPADMVAIGNPNGPGAVAGTYLGKTRRLEPYDSKSASNAFWSPKLALGTSGF